MGLIQNIARDRALAFSLLVMAAGLALRLHDLGGPSLSHPEIYIPGIDLPADISEPPPRHGFFETLDWHFNKEPHPVGYYMAMRAWTAVAGTSPEALRFPGAVAGALTILAVFFLARTLYGRLAAALAAAFIAFDGFHIFWSDNARMYAPGALLGVLSSYFLVRLMREGDPPKWAAPGYVAAAVLSLQTTEMCWLLFAVQMLYVALNSDATAKARDIVISFSRWRVPRAAYLQGAALIVSMPALAHSVYQARSEAAPAAGLTFLRDFVSFGFLFNVDPDAPHALHPAIYVVIVALLVSLALIAVGFARRPVAPDHARAAIFPVWPLYALASFSALVVFWFSTFAANRADLIALMAAFPFLAILAPLVSASFRPLVRALLPAADRILSLISARTTIASWAFAAPVALGLALSGASLFAPRAFLVFAPYGLILAAAGLSALWGRRPVFAALLLIVAALFADGLAVNAHRTQSPRDYKGTAALLESTISPGDVVLTHYRDWADTPLFYYFDTTRVVAAKGPDPLGGKTRAWVVRWKDLGREALDKRMGAALADFSKTKVIAAPDAEFTLYERKRN